MAERIDALGIPVRLWQYETHFVHAKLVAAVPANGDALVMSGSANLSKAALMSSAPGESGNVEAAVFSRMAPAEARDLFGPPGIPVKEMDLAEVSKLSFTSGPLEETAFRFHLLFARFTPTNQVEIGTSEEELQEVSG